MASLSVLLGSSANASLCVTLMGAFTSGMLAFVVCAKPFDDGSHECAEMMTSADKMQAYSLAATLVGLLVDFVCLQSPDWGDGGSDGFVGFLMALIGVVPLAVGMYESRKEKPSDAGDETADSESQDNPVFDKADGG